MCMNRVCLCVRVCLNVCVCACVSVYTCLDCARNNVCDLCTLGCIGVLNETEFQSHNFTLQVEGVLHCNGEPDCI